MTNKIIQATNSHGILTVRLTEELISIRFSPDSETCSETVLVIDINPSRETLDTIVPVI